MRIWLVTAGVVGALVAIVLIATKDPRHDPEPAPAQPEATRAPAPLQEAEVRTYLAVAPETYRLYGEAAQGFQNRRVASGGDVSGADIGDVLRAQVEALLEKHQLSLEAWNRLRNRVEYAVNAVRALKDADERHARIREKLGQKEELLKMATDVGRPVLEQDIAKLKEQLAWEGPPLHDRDRQLIERYWDQIERHVPTIGPR